MKKTAVAAATAIALGCGLTVALAAPASADTVGCVTRAEYRAAKKGMTKPRVHQIFDTAGKREAIAHSGGYGSEVRSYKGCGSPFSVVAIAYSKNPGKPWKLSAKSAVWAG